MPPGGNELARTNTTPASAAAGSNAFKAAVPESTNMSKAVIMFGESQKSVPLSDATNASFSTTGNAAPVSSTAGNAAPVSSTAPQSVAELAAQYKAAVAEARREEKRQADAQKQQAAEQADRDKAARDKAAEEEHAEQRKKAKARADKLFTERVVSLRHASHMCAHVPALPCVQMTQPCIRHHGTGLQR